MKSSFLVAALVLAILSFTTYALAPAASARPAQDIKIGGVKLKKVRKKNGKLQDGKLKTPFGKAKISNGKIKARL